MVQLCGSIQFLFAATKTFVFSIFCNSKHESSSKEGKNVYKCLQARGRVLLHILERVPLFYVSCTHLFKTVAFFHLSHFVAFFPQQQKTTIETSSKLEKSNKFQIFPTPSSFSVVSSIVFHQIQFYCLV